MPISNESKQILRDRLEKLRERKQFLNTEIDKITETLTPLKDERNLINTQIEKIQGDLK